VDFRAELLDQTRVFGDLIRSADPATPVPSCPGWTLKQLFRHVGRGNRWAAQIIADHRASELDPRMVRDGKPPDDPDAAIDWLNDGAQLIIDAVEVVGPVRVWTFIGPRPAGWWIRRRLHEATVHRADAAHAVGSGFELAPELAADAISEWIELMANMSTEPPPLERGQTMHLHATDDGLGPTGEQLLGVPGEPLVELVVAGHENSHRAAIGPPGPARLLPHRGDGAGEAVEHAGVEPADVDAELEGVRGDDAS